MSAPNLLSFLGLAPKDISRVLDRDDREAHGLFAGEAGAVRVVGAIHDVLDTGEGRLIADLYVQAGPEFFAVDCKDLPGARLQPGTPVEITLAGVRCYPSEVSSGGQ